MVPEITIMVPMNSPAAITTNRPTRVRSRVASMLLPDPFRVHFQVVHFVVLRRIRDPVEELADARVPAVPDLIGGADGGDVSAVDEDHAVGNQEGAGEFVGYDH